ncbi:glutamate synthase large subunit [Agrococcus sp. Ld7]|uniref:glutamate synthase large subunit n=1 Tax=Agrococcus sp. Ld7 TaxID=649148 RepID=UPI0038649772
MRTIDDRSNGAFTSRDLGLPAAEGLYDPRHERDSCGLAMVATTRGTAGHDIVALALDALRNLEHRGAVGSDAGTGDGAGILTQLPDGFLRAVVDFDLPDAGTYAAGIAYLPLDAAEREQVKERIWELAGQERLRVLGWREVPTVPDALGKLARAALPAIEQLFVTGANGPTKGIELDRLTWRLRKRIERELGEYLPSLSSRTITYKGMVTTLQLEPFYPDLSDDRFETKLAIVHSRYSTNTFPSWPLAQPLRMIAHNGEINTVEGNRNWMAARESQLASELLGDLRPLKPIVTPGLSDSSSFDEVLELLTLAGRSLPHAIMMMVPPAWENQTDMPQDLRDFAEYHSLLMEPWDGPAAISFTDGSLVGATLDRNGLRPGRWLETDDGLVVLASETGVLPIDPSRVVRRGRLQPGVLFLVDTEAGRVVPDAEVKRELAQLEPWGEWLDSSRIHLAELPDREHVAHTPASVTRRQRTFGYTEEEVRILIAPMAKHGAEPLGAMGSDTPIAVLAERPRLLFDYFTQAFAQVTNPPLDSLREAIVTSMTMGLGPVRNLLTGTPSHASQIILDFPVIDNGELAKIRSIDRTPGSRRTVVVKGLYRVEDGPAATQAAAMERRLEAMCREVDEAILDGAQYVILSDRDSTDQLAPIPTLLMTSAVHHHLIRASTRMRVGIVVEAGDVREVHHVALLIGYGASAVNPYLAMETAEQLALSGQLGADVDTAVRNLITALGKGVTKIMSKMGISTVGSYGGAQAFEAIGLSQQLVDRYFTGTHSPLGGVGLDVIAEENRMRHRGAYPDERAPFAHERLATGGEYQWRRDGAPHLFNPETVFKLQHATRTGRYEVFQDYTRLVDEQAAQLQTLRGLMRLRTDGIEPIPIDEVEPVAEIVRRFSTGAMSYGSISQEAHETLAIAMNRLGGKSNTGEGGEDVDRLLDPARRSAVKQVASGRFGVTSMYLTHADDIQIKMAQGAKPGEGGQLPPGKVYPWVARTRYATAGVGLISPPPHHDIYSIEDLKQLIFDLKRANTAARVHVKLVSQSGIGAVAAGVAKAKADVVLVSGHDGGTGASPLNSLKHAGTPWEIGLAETQHTLMVNGLRERVSVQVDGQLKTGRDVIIGALLGAEEFGFATAPLVVSGCIMMRVCHLDTCPVGVATQNPVLRQRFTGKPEFVVQFFEFLAQQVRELLAQLGLRTLDEAIGRSDLLDADPAIRHWKAEGLDLAPVLTRPAGAHGAPRRTTDQDHELEQQLDTQLLPQVDAALDAGERLVLDLEIANTDRAVGTMLGNLVTRRAGEAGLEPGTIDLTLRGSAGQSLGAFVPRGITLRLHGDANDYVGKGLSGGLITVRPPASAALIAEQNVIAGNVIGYGATSGELYLRGVVGERFLVRNSGATAVCEGAGDHALEYMTGGIAVILGATGRNIGAGMSGGAAYVLDLDPRLLNQDSFHQGELRVERLRDEDAIELRAILERHLELTGSAVASQLLAGDLSRVSKLVPRDWAMVRDIRLDAEQQGLDPDSDNIWRRILEVTGG